MCIASGHCAQSPGFTENAHRIYPWTGNCAHFLVNIRSSMGERGKRHGESMSSIITGRTFPTLLSSINEGSQKVWPCVIHAYWRQSCPTKNCSKGFLEGEYISLALLQACIATKRNTLKGLDYHLIEAPEATLHWVRPSEYPALWIHWLATAL